VDNACCYGDRKIDENVEKPEKQRDISTAVKERQIEIKADE